MAHLSEKNFDVGEESSKNLKSLKHTKYTLKGRHVTAPKKYWTTSSDEMLHKPKKTVTSVKKELTALSSVIKNNPAYASTLKQSDHMINGSKISQSKATTKVNQSVSSSQMQKNLNSSTSSKNSKMSLKIISDLPVSPSTLNQIRKETVAPLLRKNNEVPDVVKIQKKSITLTKNDTSYEATSDDLLKIQHSNR